MPLEPGFTRRFPPLGGRKRVRLCLRVPALGAASPQAVGQLSAFRSCSLGVHDVGHVGVGAADPHPEETELSLP